jgi:hypothetical protein
VSEGKAKPVQAWTDPEGFRRLRFPDFMTAIAPAVFTLQEIFLVLISVRV